MKTYENKEEMLKVMFDMDANDIPNIISNSFDDTDDVRTKIAKMVCSIVTRLVENAGGEARFDIEAIANDDKMDDIVDEFGDCILDLYDLVASHGEITGIEVLDEEK